MAAIRFGTVYFGTIDHSCPGNDVGLMIPPPPRPEKNQSRKFNQLGMGGGWDGRGGGGAKLYIERQ